jgi:hypothetical protein
MLVPFFFHWQVIGRAPVTVATKVTELPSAIDLLWGCEVNMGGPEPPTAGINRTASKVRDSPRLPPETRLKRIVGVVTPGVKVTVPTVRHVLGAVFWKAVVNAGNPEHPVCVIPITKSPACVLPHRSAPLVTST